MRRNSMRAGAIGTALLAAMATTSLADSKDYEFQLIDQAVKQGDAVIAVKLVHKPSGRPIPDAVIFAKRIDMGPDGMAMMDSPLEPVAATEPGVYRFKTKLTMAGRWALSLAAKVQGEAGTVENKLIVTATQ
ncbi:MAG: FixH family protein [Hyphomicrobium sp.]|uniref:FixH family protein n=1 Tax=Hyphomicrobium sp. TaxID=82 RepID=UPI0013279483|nr:FixH family protein [Hyphomicrobium sp.]KAB2943717.1 MAG: FixH family protein [Hyphomicrobium sp.]MBZ0208926.1 FixH family protein [Hyphomicrobium sp.]